MSECIIFSHLRRYLHLNGSLMIHVAATLVPLHSRSIWLYMHPGGMTVLLGKKVGEFAVLKKVTV